MEYSADRWVQRLRDGEMPRTWPFVVLLVVMVLAGVAGLVAEVTHPGAVGDLTHHRRGGYVAIAPPALVVGAIGLAVYARLRTGQDRRTMGTIRDASDPAFFLPVIASSDAPSLPGPPPTIWSVDAVGLHGWTSRHAEPVLELPWAHVRSIGLWTVTAPNGSRMDVGIEMDTDHGVFVIPPRSTLGRPYPASQTKIDILMRVLRSFRRQLDPDHVTRSGRSA